MKKYRSLVLCMLLLVLTFAGCADKSASDAGGAETGDTAVSETLLENFGKSSEEAVRALGLKDEQKEGDYGYTADYAWCGQTMETKFAVNYGGSGVFGYAEAQKLFENTDESLKELQTCIDLFTKQFDVPYAVTRYTQADKTKEAYDAAQLETYFKEVSDGGEGCGVQLRFSLVGKNDRMSDDGDYTEVSVQNVGDGLRLKITLEHVNR